MKHIQLVIAASLMATCVVQVRSGENQESPDPSSSSSSYNEGTELSEIIVHAHPGGSWIEKTSTRVTFKKKSIYADDKDPGFRPNTPAMLDYYELGLSGLTPKSLLQAMGFQEIPQADAIIHMLAGLLLGEVEGKINYPTVAVFLRMFDVEALKTSTALRAITEVIREIRSTDYQMNANGYFLFKDILEVYYAQSKSASPISKESWAVLGSLIDQVLEGKRDAAEKIVHVLASHDEKLQSLINKSVADQVNIVQTLTEDVVNFRIFLEHVKDVREAED